MSQPARAGGSVQAYRTSIFFGVKVNVCHCHIFWSCSIVQFRRRKKNFGHFLTLIKVIFFCSCELASNKINQNELKINFYFTWFDMNFLEGCKLFFTQKYKFLFILQMTL